MQSARHPIVVPTLILCTHTEATAPRAPRAALLYQYLESDVSGENRNRQPVRHLAGPPTGTARRGARARARVRRRCGFAFVAFGRRHEIDVPSRSASSFNTSCQAFSTVAGCVSSCTATRPAPTAPGGHTATGATTFSSVGAVTHCYYVVPWRHRPGPQAACSSPRVAQLRERSLTVVTSADGSRWLSQ
eukprot:COSAG02_NODE_4274_length_5560_cov_2.722212_3_plen_189_part_00